MYLHANAKLGLAGRFALASAVEGGASLRSAALLPIAFARCSAGNAATITASELGTSSAPAAPCKPARSDQDPGRRVERARDRKQSEAPAPSAKIRRAP